MHTLQNKTRAIVYALALRKAGKQVVHPSKVCADYVSEVFAAMSSVAFAHGLARLITEILALPIADEYDRVILRLILLAEKAQEMHERMKQG